ncbi:MAG: dihydrofolate reductase family protein [Fimbriimonadaceae bacterium]|nr:dihydrofolate reductase family protein [Fimbriimonadaceae bacterium]
MRVTMLAAVSVDGKIGPPDRTAVHFGAADRRRLEQHCAAAEVLVMGAGALRAHRTTVPLRDPALLAARAAAGQPPQPLTVIVSRRGTFDPDLPFFTRQGVPRRLATTQAAAVAAELWDEGVWRCGEQAVDCAELARRLAAAGVRRVALLGGGELNAAWLQTAPLHRLELTIAPRLCGGATAPTLVDGGGLPVPRELRLLTCEAEEGQLFTSWEVLP